MKNMGGAVDEVLVNISASHFPIRWELNFFGDFIADFCGNIIAISADSDISWNDSVSVLSSAFSCVTCFFKDLSLQTKTWVPPMSSHKSKR